MTRWGDSASVNIWLMRERLLEAELGTAAQKKGFSVSCFCCGATALQKNQHGDASFDSKHPIYTMLVHNR